MRERSYVCVDASVCDYVGVVLDRAYVCVRWCIYVCGWMRGCMCVACACVYVYVGVFMREIL